METVATDAAQVPVPSTASHMVVPGKEGYLFLTNDASEVMEQVEGRKVLSPEMLWGIAMTHSARRQYCGEILGAGYDHWLVPDRETALEAFLPDEIIPHRDGPRSYPLYRGLGCEALHRPFFNADLLRASAGQAYFKTDTHWTWQGCMTYLRDFAERGRSEWLKALASISFEDMEYGFVGDLGGKVGAEEERSRFGVPPTGSRLPLFDNAIQNVGHARFYRNSDAPLKERVVVLHDSFGEWLTTILPHLVSECLFIHSPDFDPVFLKRFAPKFVLLCQIERFFIRPPLNGISMPRLIAEEENEKGCQHRFAEFDWEKQDTV